MTAKRDPLSSAYEDTIHSLQPVRKRHIALVGHPDGETIDVDERPGFIWVRINGRDDRLRQAYARNILPRYNLPVRVAYSDNLPDTLEVVDLNIQAFPPSVDSPGGWDGTGYLGRHAAQHDLGGGDTDWIQSKRFLPLRARAQASPNMTIFVMSGWYPYGSGWNYWPGGSSSDMTAHVPSTAGNALYRIVYIAGATNALTYANTAEFADDPLFAPIEEILDSLPLGSIPICAVYLANGTTTITEAMIFDLRSFVGTSPGTVAAGGGSGVVWGNMTIVATSGGDYTSIQTALDTESAGITLLIMTATYLEAVTHKNGYTLQGMTAFDGDVIISPAAGVPLTIPATGAHLFEIYGVRLSPPAGAVGLSFASGATGTVTVDHCRIDSNGTNAIDASAADATLAFTLRDSAVNGDVSLKCATTLIDTRITGNVTQSASAGNLTIDGGYISGNLSHVTGSTITLRNLPRIDGTVSGSGTIVGAYLNSSGTIVGQGGSWSGTHTHTANIIMNSGADITFGNSGALTQLATSLSLGFDAESITIDDAASIEIVAQNVSVDGSTFDVNANLSVTTGFVLKIIDLTSTRVPFITTGGQFTDSANFVFVSGTPQLQIGSATGSLVVGVINSNESALGYSVNTAGHEGVSLWHDGAEGWITSVDSGTAWHDVTVEALNVRFDLNANVDRFVFTSAGQFQAPVTGSTGGIRIGGDVDLWRDAANVLRIGDNVQIDSEVGIGQVAVATQGVTVTASAVAFVGNVSDAGTTNTVSSLILRHRTSGTAAAGFGIQTVYNLHDDGGTDRNVAIDQVFWVTAASASRAARRVFFVHDAGGAREGMRMEASGSAPMLGFYGGGAAVKQTVTGSRGGNAALASLLTALATIGLITDSSSA